MKISKKGGLVLLALGALAVYKYNKMTDEEKTALKDKAKKLYDDHLSPLVKSALGLAGDDDDAVVQNEPIK